MFVIDFRSVWEPMLFSVLQILPHPSFVYCSTFVYPEQTIVTGCYDGMVRIWWHTHASSRHWLLHQELSGHEEYVSAVCSFKNKEFFSGDNSGLIIHWAVDESARLITSSRNCRYPARVSISTFLQMVQIKCDKIVRNSKFGHQ